MLMLMMPTDYYDLRSPQSPQTSSTGSTFVLKGAGAPSQDGLTTAAGSGDGDDFDGDAAVQRLITLLDGERDRMLAEGRFRWPA